MKKILRRLITISLFGVAIFFIWLAIKEQLPYMAAKQEYKMIQDAYVMDAEPGDEFKVIDFDKLRAEYPDVIAWIHIPDTQIDYPVCRGDDDEYYLNHNPAQQYNKLGAIFVPSVTAEDLSDAHTIIYGHNMRSGQMFGELSGYSAQEYRDQHPYVYIYTPERALKCYIYNAYTCIAGDENYETDMDLHTSEYIAWLGQSQQPAAYDEYTEISSEQQVFTLSTCVNSGSRDERFIVHCAVEVTKEQAEV